MKQRISSLDLKLIISELETTIKGYRLQNIYNLVSNNRSFLLKFQVPDSKYSLVLESGFKVYLTEFQRPTLPEPNNFTAKLRKHLKTKRLTNIKQVGDDRIAVLEFSDGFYYLVFEFFSAGNIILLDSDLKIMTLFRFVDPDTVPEGQYQIGSVYSMFNKSLFENDSQVVHNEVFDKQTVLKWIEDTKQQEREKKKVLSIEKLCFQHTAYISSDLLHITMLDNNIEPKTTCLELLQDEQLLERTEIALNDAQSRYKALLDIPVGEVEGFIISNKNPLFDEESGPSPENLEYIYNEFHPYNPVHKVKEGVKVESFIGYNKTVDHFFTTIEMSKVSLSRQNQQANIQKRLQFVKDEHAKKIEALDTVQELNFKKGYLINVYNNQIEECKEAVQKLLDQKMDWKNIEKLIKIEQTRGNEIAKMIKSLNLIKNEITITLVDIDENDNNEEDGDENDETDDSEWSSDESDSDDNSHSQTSSKDKSLKNSERKLDTVDVVIDITQSAFSNSTRYFDAKKIAKEKQDKTAKSAALAIKSSEQKIYHDLKKLEKEAKQNVEFKQLRPKFWFEKFFWFITSEGYLCIAGRDDSQIDSIYYRYFDNETDYLVSNDLEGALKVFIKNPYKNKDLPPSTLLQAGIFSLTTTKAWENKQVISPWFVSGKEVSKKDYDGSILPSGMLNVSREKTYLPPCQMVMGAGLLWLSDHDTLIKYRTNRLKRDEELELSTLDKSLGYANKVQELKSMLTKLQEDEEKAKVAIGEADKEKDDITPENEDIVDNSDMESERDNIQGIAPPTPNQQPKLKIRGKKKKLKKIKEKYGEQDDEERRLRMAVLGTLKQVESQNIVDNSINKETSERVSAAIKKQRKRQQQINQITKLIEDLEKKNDDIDVTETDTDAIELSNMVNDVENYHLNIAGLLPSPNKTDKVTDCIPVFAPWNALNKYAYKVKLQPGNLKKGKTVNDVIENLKRITTELKSENVDWYDNENFVELINPQEFLLSLTASKFKVGSGLGNSKNNKPRGGNNKSKGGNSKSKKK
ncbi:hypothetical protein CANINC_002414 [Pichia inconspicua]|uniref:Ribosome quality control complex subunit 2 n=1 Tax=Pichia inconspicua TaxID=52247 RepID=A0A4T0X1M9_9ASCO|nr:hypothetical protein CANINC_002414 [[Candida] inconspicua]